MGTNKPKQMEKRNYWIFSRNKPEPSDLKSFQDPTCQWAENRMQNLAFELVGFLLLTLYLYTLFSRYRRRPPGQTTGNEETMSTLQAELEESRSVIKKQQAQLHKFERQLLRASRTNRPSNNDVTTSTITTKSRSNSDDTTNPNRNGGDSWKREKEQLSEEVKRLQNQVKELTSQIQQCMDGSKGAAAQYELIQTNARLQQAWHSNKELTNTMEALQEVNAQQKLRLEGLERLRSNDLFLIRKQQETIQQKKEELEDLRRSHNKEATELRGAILHVPKKG